VIPVLNDVAGIRKCIDSILRQSVTVSEIIALDSGSTDGTLDVLESYPIVRVVHIAPGEFNHGSTRSVGAREATGELILFTVQDASAASDRWIERLLEGFVRDDVAAVCGRQIVPPAREANPLDWYRPLNSPETRIVQFKDAAEFDALAPADKLDACGWDNVTAMYRHSVLKRIPFRPAVYGEDALWARDALRAGFALVYNDAAQVCHFHRENPEFTFRRSILVSCLRYRAFGFRHEPVKIASSIRRILRRIVNERTLTVSERLNWITYNLRNVIAQRSALAAFDRALAGGDSAVDALCMQYSDRPPSPIRVSPTSTGIAQ
jgi:rhamnosyltransferase